MCTHTKYVMEKSTDFDGYGNKFVTEDYVEYSTFEDIDTHRYYCTQCNKVMYYSKSAKDYYERGIECNIKGLGV